QYQFSRPLQRLAELRRILAAGFGLVGLAAASTTDNWRDLLDEIAGMQPLRLQVIGDDCPQAYFIVFRPTESDDATPGLGHDPVHLGANLLHGSAGHFADDDLRAANFGRFI